jgi:hypothetical protein
MTSVFEWVEEELRRRFDLSSISRDQEKEARFVLWREWCNANQLRLLEVVRKKDIRGGPSSVVYFAQENVNDAIKIGTSTQVKKRIRSLEQFYRCTITILATVVGRHRVESWMHYRFERYRLYGEWFRPAPELLAYIAEIK